MTNHTCTECGMAALAGRRKCSLHVRRGACEIDDCGRRVKGRGLCESHLRKLRKWGDATRERPSAHVRFWAKVDKTDACWLWTAATRAGGYGEFWHDGRLVEAHRFSYELVNGPISPGMTIDHLCYVRGCVNPGHLEEVTMAENVQRAFAAGRHDERIARLRKTAP